jgi:rhomboid protease GluP
MVEPTEVVIRVAVDQRQAEAWAFVLEALVIPHRVLVSEEGSAIVVDARQAAKASAALEAADREASEVPPPEPAAPDSGPSSIGVVLAMSLVAFFFVTGSRGESRWFAAGSAVAELIVNGAWWRAITALTLHANLGHVAGNAAALIIFVSALGRWLGPGVASWLVLFTGTAGNLINAYVHGTHHDSIGASTAAFGAIGLMGGLQFVRRARWKVRSDWRRRALTAIAATLGIFAMIGGAVDLRDPSPLIPRDIDVTAHVAGMLVGLLTGFLVGRLPRRAPPLAQLGLGLGSLTVILLAWLRALS